MESKNQWMDVCNSRIFLWPLLYFNILHLLSQAGDSAPEEPVTATQIHGEYMPIVREKPTVDPVKVTEEMKSFRAYAKLRLERMNKKHAGARLKRAAEAEKEDEKVTELALFFAFPYFLCFFGTDSCLYVLVILRVLLYRLFICFSSISCFTQLVSIYEQ